MSEVAQEAHLGVEQHWVRTSILGQIAYSMTASGDREFSMAEKLDRQCWSKERFQKEPDCRASLKELQFPASGMVHEQAPRQFA